MKVSPPEKNTPLPMTVILDKYCPILLILVEIYAEIY